MRRNDTGTPKKKTRRAAGQMVASAVMALAIAVGGFGTTALLASQPAGLTVEPGVYRPCRARLSSGRPGSALYSLYWVAKRFWS